VKCALLVVPGKKKTFGVFGVRERERERNLWRVTGGAVKSRLSRGRDQRYLAF
jgi:hypothetical protein